MKIAIYCLFVLLTTTFVLSGYAKPVYDGPNALSVQKEGPNNENNTETEQNFVGLETHGTYPSLLSKAPRNLLPSYKSYSNDTKQLVRKKRVVGRLFRAIVRLLRGDGSRKLKRITPRGSPRKTTRSGGRTTYQYDKQGGFAQATRDFDQLRPRNIRNIPNGRFGIVGDFSVNVRQRSSDGRPTLEYFKTIARTEVVKIRYLP